MDLEEIKQSLGELLEVTFDLANDNPVPESESRYLRVLEGVFRKNYVRLQGIQMLVEHTTTSNVAMEVTRNMVEDIVGIEYMKLKGAEQYAEKFFKYWAVHYYHLTHRTHQGDEISQDEAKEAESRYNALPATVRNRKNWAGSDVATQLQAVFDSEALSQSDANMVEIAYTTGSLKTHFNPYDLMAYLHGDYFESTSDLALRMSLVFAISSQVRMTTKYVDAINSDNNNENYKHYGDKANAIISKYALDEMADSLLKK